MDTIMAFAALGGIGLVALGNLSRYRRTGNKGCLGHFFVDAEELETHEWLLNRTGIAVFALGIALAVAL